VAGTGNGKPVVDDIETYFEDARETGKILTD
jgi:hypothetical protein